VAEGAVLRYAKLYPSLPKARVDRSSSSTIKPPLLAELRPPPVKIVYSEHGLNLKCYTTGFPVPSFHLDTVTGAESVTSVIGRIHIGKCDFLTDSPFYGKHEISRGYLNRVHRCTSSYLALGTTVSPGILGRRLIATCILRARRTCDQHRGSRLVDFDMNLIRLPGKVVVARLWGYSQARVTSLPEIVAYSLKGSRIAIADWDKILVWALSPEVLVDDDTGTRYYDTTWDDSFENDVVVLKPILLKAGSVVRQMVFGRTENELVVLTTIGVQIWNLGPSAKGMKIMRYLEKKD
jgi:hypothetical protein